MIEFENSQWSLTPLIWCLLSLFCRSRAGLAGGGEGPQAVDEDCGNECRGGEIPICRDWCRGSGGVQHTFSISGTSGGFSRLVSGVVMGLLQCCIMQEVSVKTILCPRQELTCLPKIVSLDRRQPVCQKSDSGRRTTCLPKIIFSAGEQPVCQKSFLSCQGTPCMLKIMFYNMSAKIISFLPGNNLYAENYVQQHVCRSHIFSRIKSNSKYGIPEVSFLN